MRTGALALLLLIAACGEPESAPPGAAGNGTAVPDPDVPDAAATVTIAASGPGNCSARWNGQPVTGQQLLERSAALIDRALATAGGVGNVTRDALPAINIDAPAGLGFACADTVMAPIRRAGLTRVVLRPDGGAAPALADFALSDIAGPPPFVAVTVGAGGRMTWNGREVSLDDLATRIEQMGAAAGDIEAPPGELELRPARDAAFGQVHAALLKIRQGRLRAALLLPSVTPNPRPPLPAPRAGPPPEVQRPTNLSGPAPTPAGQ